MDKDALRGFMGRFMQMTTDAAVFGLVSVCERTGLFRALAGRGPLGLDEIVEHSGLQRRYLEEALSGLAAAGILRYRASDESFELPDEHAACLADETSPYFLAGWTQIVPALYRAIPGVAQAFAEGGGVPFSEFGEEMVEGIARSNGPGTRVLLTRKWLPAADGLVERLEAGISVADVGCGAGTAALTLASAYPRSSVTGFDIDAASVARARQLAREAGLDNLRFEQRDIQGLPTDPGFDLITSFDVIHDLVDPRGALAQIRKALREAGTYFMVEPAAADTLEQNLNPSGALLYAMSTLHCMTVSLAHGGAGLGTAFGAKRVERMCEQAGFSSFARLEIENPFNAFYALRP